MISNERIITLYKNFFRITIYHGWKAEKIFYDVKKEIENEKEIDWQHLYQKLIWQCLQVKLLWRQNSVFLFCLTLYKKQTHE